MNDDQQNNAFVSNQTQSYVDAYTPPQAPVTMPDPIVTSNTIDNTFDAVEDEFVHPAPSISPTITPAPATTSNPQGLGEQNIFAMLGVSDGTEAQKEAFLDELQQVIWEDFLENDVELLISSEDYAKMKELLQGQQSVNLEQQEKIVVFLEKLIPDLEDIMLEKALALKGDMFKERIAGMRQFFAGKTEELSKIDQAEQLMQQDQWYAASELLNTMRG